MRSGTNNNTVLLGEDEPEVRSYLEMALKCEGYSVESAENGEEVMSCLQNRPSSFSAVLLDIIMPRMDGLEALRQIRRMDKDLPVIMVSGAYSPSNVVDAMKSGATELLVKPINHLDLRKALSKVLEKQSGDGRSATVPWTPVVATKRTFVGANPTMKEMYAVINRVGWSEAPVLIQGETGSGKEVLARELHAQSPRAGKPFLKLNCAALPSELVESELFGYERGAFTGAFQRKPGMFELAEGGSILLDEIGDMDYKLQAKLLQVLQDREFQRLGGKEVIRVNVRVIAATHRDLDKEMAEGHFREDLYYRLDVINLRLPPLREREEDIVPLTEFFLGKYANPAGPPISITPALREALMLHHWPGNIRELENVVRKLIVLGDPDRIARDLCQSASRRISTSRPALATQPSLRDEVTPDAPILEQVTKAKVEAETGAILAALNSTRWNRKQAAALLNIDYKALLYKMKKLSIGERAVAAEPKKTVDRETGVPLANQACAGR